MLQNKYNIQDPYLKGRLVSLPYATQIIVIPLLCILIIYNYLDCFVNKHKGFLIFFGALVCAAS